MASALSLKRLQQLIWVLIYGGLLSVVLGLSMQRFEPTTGWSLVTGGGLVALVGVVLIFVRARLKLD